MIEINNLQKIIDRRIALDIDKFSVEPGMIVGVVGAAGSGKDVLRDLLTGRTRPSAGVVRVATSDPATDQARFSECAGVVFHEDALYKTLSPRANLEFNCKLYGIPKSRAGEILALVGLADQANTKLESLPSGLLRRLAFGRAILHDPQVLILEEPFARCDEASISLLSTIIRRYGESGVAILIISTDQANILSLCSIIFTLHDGRIIDSLHPRNESASQYPFKIPVRLEEKVILINPADILYADASEGKAFIVTPEGRLPTQFTLSELEQRLARSGFFRAHRSYLVNLQHVKEVIPYTRNSYSLRLDDVENAEIPLSKAAAGELKGLLGY
jgi:ABC-2 type transport system ATP-binding protein